MAESSIPVWKDVFQADKKVRRIPEAFIIAKNMIEIVRLYKNF